MARTCRECGSDNTRVEQRREMAFGDYRTVSYFVCYSCGEEREVAVVD